MNIPICNFYINDWDGIKLIQKKIFYNYCLNDFLFYYEEKQIWSSNIFVRERERGREREREADRERKKIHVMAEATFKNDLLLCDINNIHGGVNLNETLNE